MSWLPPCRELILDAVSLLRTSALPLLAAAAVAAAPPPPDPQIRFRERVEVERVLVDARAVDDAGMPLPDLGPKDFRLRVDGKVVPLESTYWVAATQKEPEPEGATTEAYVVTPEPVEGEAAPGRLIVFFFQKDFDESRLTGLLRMQKTALTVIDNLAVGDRAAVVSFDSHLKLRLDFTSDRETLRATGLHTFGDKPNVTYLVHGEPDASSQLRDTMTKELGWNVQVAQWMQKVEIK